MTYCLQENFWWRFIQGCGSAADWFVTRIINSCCSCSSIYWGNGLNVLIYYWGLGFFPALNWVPGELEEYGSRSADEYGALNWVPSFPFTTSKPLILFVDLWSSYLVALTTQLKAAQKVLSDEKAARSVDDHFLSEEKAARQITERALQTSNDAKAKLSKELETTHTSLTTTCDKLTIKSTSLDTAMIQKDEAKIQLAKAEEKLKAAKEEMKTQRQSLDSA
jgi:hypothetical protein